MLTLKQVTDRYRSLLKQGLKGIIVTIMALIRFENGKRQFVSAEEGSRLWLVKTGEKKGTAADRALVKRIAKFYLNRNNAPVSYLVTVPDPTAVARPVPYARLPYIDKD